MDELNFRQKKFCREYVKNKGNATKAALKAGYSKKTAYHSGYENLKKPQISEYIAKLTKDKTDVDELDVLEELKSVTFYRMTDFLEIKDGKMEIFDSKDISPDKIPAIKKIKQKTKKFKTHEELETEYEFHDRIEGIKLFGKHFGMFKDKIEHSGEIGVQIVDDLSD